MTDPVQLVRRQAALESARTVHEPVWRECFDYTSPLRGSGLQSTELTAQSAIDKRATQLDSTGADSARILASAVVSGTTPANSRWFSLEVADATNEEKRWLDESADRLWRNIHSDTFDAVAFEAAMDLVGAGFFVMYVDENPEGGFLFELWPIAECYFTTSKAGGRVDTVFRKFHLTAEQALEQFGENNISEEIRKAIAAKKYDEKFCFIRAVYPRKQYAVDALLPQNMRFASCTVEHKAKKLVRESGYHEFPLIVPRWTLIPGTCYAIGPAADALPDMRMLNTLCFDELANAELAIAGMWIAQDDGVLNPRTVKVGPRKVIVANSIESMAELKSGGDWQIADFLVQRKQAQIRKVFMADQLQPQDGPQMTAYEVHVRVALIRQLLGPTYGRLQAEYLKPLVERCFAIAYRAGLFDEAPASLGERPYTIKYSSPLARAQSLEEVSAMDQHELALANQAVLKPDVGDTYDFDEAARERARLLGVPAKLIVDERQVLKIREARADAASAAREQDVQDEVVAGAGPDILKRAVA